MRLLLPYLILLLFLFQLKLKKTTKKSDTDRKVFLDREAKANSTRKKDISKLDYITIPDTLPLSYPDCDDTVVVKSCAAITSLSDKKMLNLSGISNTDLKLSYGVANLAALTEYDTNFSDLARNIAVLGNRLLELGYTQQAVELLEFGIVCETDISSNYTALADYYKKHDMTDKITHLEDTAKGLRTINKDIILKKLSSI